MTHRPCILESLPLEIVFEIISLLDTNGIKALLIAAPWLRRHAILITDHGDKPVFFTADGLERTCVPYTSEESRHGIRLFNKYRDTQSIRLYELTCIEEEALHFFVFGDDKRGGSHPATFIYILEEMYRTAGTNPITRLIDQYAPTAKWRRDYRFLQMDYTKCSPEHSSYLSSLKSLFVQCVQDFGGMDLSTVTDLDISISQDSNDQPLIHDLKLPNIRNLKIEYSGEVPRFINIDVGSITCQSTSANTGYWTRSLMITNMSYSDGSSSFYSNTKVKDTAREFGDLSFTKMFTHFRANGTPNEFLKQCDFSEALGFIWNKSFPEYTEEEREPWRLSLPKVEYLDLTVSTNGARLPMVVHEGNVKYFDLCLSILAADINVVDFLMSATPVSAKWLFVDLFRSLSLLNRRGPSGEVLSYEVMTVDEWTRWADQTLEATSKLSIVGVSLPLLFTKLSGRTTKEYFEGATLMPVIGSAEDAVFDSNGDLAVDGFSHHGLTSPIIHLAPVIISEKRKRKRAAAKGRTLILDLHIEDGVEDLDLCFKLSTEPEDFEKFQFQDEELPTPASYVIGRSLDYTAGRAHPVVTTKQNVSLITNDTLIRHCWVIFGGGPFEECDRPFQYGPVVRLDNPKGPYPAQLIFRPIGHTTEGLIVKTTRYF